MKKIVARLLVIALVLTGSLLYAAPADACGRGFCKPDIWCYICDELILYVTECFIPRCFLCETRFCSSAPPEQKTALFLDEEQQSCSDALDPSATEAPAIEVDWLEARI